MVYDIQFQLLATFDENNLQSIFNAIVAATQQDPDDFLGSGINVFAGSLNINGSLYFRQASDFVELTKTTIVL